MGGGGGKDTCASCHLVLREPHAACCGCPGEPGVCLDCFARGSSFAGHDPGHPYRIVRESFSVLDPGWTAAEEEALLNSLLQRGHGNWDDIARAVGVDKTPGQCQEHFEDHYVENRTGRMLDAWKAGPPTTAARSRRRPVAATAPEDFPPRPQRGTAAHRDLAGYNPARADFESEQDNRAELDLSAATFDAVREGMELREKLRDGDLPEDEEEEEEEADRRLDCLLQLSAAEAYNNKLRKRQRTKAVVRELGLLNKSKTVGAGAAYDQLAQSGGPAYAKLGRFARLGCSVDHDFVLEGLRHELQLRQGILRLQDLRANGLTRRVSVAFFARRRRQRERSLREVPGETVAQWIARGAFGNVVVATEATSPPTAGRSKAARVLLPAAATAAGSARRAAAPLDLVGLPGTERLSAEERSLCSAARIPPETYFEVRSAMVAECRRLGGLRLADARPLAKMDVNKTRKMYDFLFQGGVITKPNK